MGKKEQVCRCGGSFNENGICMECGKKRQRSAGYRVFHGILIVLASLILLLCLSSTLTVRHYILYNNVTNGLRSSKISDFEIPFSGETVTDYIRREFVTDDAVLPEDIAGALDEMNITGYFADKADELGKMLRGESDTYPELKADDIVALLEKNEDRLYSKCMLVVEESDKEDIRAELSDVFDLWNGAADILYGSKAGRALARFRVSIARAVIDLVLLGLLLWRWIKVRRRSGKPGYGAVRGMGWVFFVPSLLVLIGCAVTAIQLAFKPDSVTGLYTLIQGIRTPHWLLAPLTLAFGILLMTLAGFIRGRMLYPKKKKQEELPARTAPAGIPEKQAEPAAPVRTADAQPARPAAVTTAPAESAPRPVTGTAAQQPAQTTATTAAKPQTAVKSCVSCGKEIPAGASFCIYCGANQNPQQPKAELEAEIDDILRETAPEAPGQTGSDDALN